MEFGDKLKLLRSEMNLTREELARKINISYSTISKYEQSARFPDKDTLNKLSSFFNCNIDYLLGNTNIRESVDNLYRANPQSAETGTIKVPLLTKVNTNTPILSHENYREEIKIPYNINADFALKVEGDSMSWAGILENDIALLKSVKTPSNGSIVAVCNQDGALKTSLNFYIEEDGRKYFQPANPNLKSFEMNSQHMIIGEVVLILKNPPSFKKYKSLLYAHNIQNDEWKEAIEKAAQYGMDGRKTASLIDLFAYISKQL